MSPADPRQFDRVCFVFVRLCPPGELFVSVAFVSIDQSELTFGMQWRLCQTFGGHVPSESRSRSRWVLYSCFLAASGKVRRITADNLWSATFVRSACGGLGQLGRFKEDLWRSFVELCRDRVCSLLFFYTGRHRQEFRPQIAAVAVPNQHKRHKRPLLTGKIVYFEFHGKSNDLLRSFTNTHTFPSILNHSTPPPKPGKPVVLVPSKLQDYNTSK